MGSYLDTYPSPTQRDGTLDNNLVEVHFTRAYRGQPLASAVADLGQLENLPYELLRFVMIQMDLEALLSFGLVNRRASALLQSIPEYQLIVKHAPDALRGIQRIGTGRWFTFGDLYSTLCTVECEHCNDFGGYLYLITCRRVCFLCFTESEHYLPLRLSHCVAKFGVARAMLKALPQMRSIPGRYSTSERYIKECITLVDHRSALSAAIKCHGSMAALTASTLDHGTDRQQDHSHSSSTTRATAQNIQRRPPKPEIYDAGEQNPLRFMAIVNAPCLDPKGQTADPGFHCEGCEHGVDRPLHFRRKFNAKSYEIHLQRYGGVKEGEHLALQQNR